MTVPIHAERRSNLPAWILVGTVLAALVGALVFMNPSEETCARLAARDLLNEKLDPLETNRLEWCE